MTEVDILKFMTNFSDIYYKTDVVKPCIYFEHNL